MRKTLLASLLLLAPACGGTDPGVLPDANDTPPADASAMPGPNHVAFTATGASFVDYRDGNGAWIKAAALHGDVYQLGVTDDYVVEIGCSDATGFEAQMLAGTFADGATLETSCGKGTEPTEPTEYEMTGTMQQPGTVTFGLSESSTTAPWSFDLDTPAGPNELVAYDPDKMLVRRNVEVDASGPIDDVDVEQDGVAMTSVPLTITGAGSAQPSVFTNLYTTHETANLPATATSAHVAPASLLVDGDQQILFASVDSINSDRDVSHTYGGEASETLALPPELAATLIEADHTTQATWTSLPAGDAALLLTETFGAEGEYSDEEVAVSPSWLAKTHATKLLFDATAPDLDQSWSVANADFRLLEAYQLTDTDSTVSSVYVESTPPKRAHHHARAIRPGQSLPAVLHALTSDK